MATIKKKTYKVTTKQIAMDMYKGLTEDQQKDLFTLIGKIECGDIKNFHSTKLFRTLVESMDINHRILITYICKKASGLHMFENMEDLMFVKE